MAQSDKTHIQSTRGDGKPNFHILICMIKIWTLNKGDDPMADPSTYKIITECENIEIVDSYKKLIGTASITFPRGTVIHDTITQKNVAEAKNNVTASVTSAGVVEEIRESVTKAAKTSSFSVGQRIRIYLGYTEDPKIADMAKISNTGKKDSIFSSNSNRDEYIKHMTNMFDGYITKISVDEPIELHCENMASKLKEVTCPNKKIISKATINDFLTEKGRLNLLKDTGLILSPKTKAQNFSLGKIELHDDLTLADVLMEWERYGLHSFVVGNELFIGRTYFNNAKDDSIINAVPQVDTTPEILFDYNVASNGLSLTSTDKKYLAIKATGLGSDNKFFNITIIRNPEYDEHKSSSKPYRLVNESNVTKKQMKMGIMPKTDNKDKVSMNMYSVRPYSSRKVPCTRDQLCDEAIKYLESYNMNGIEGSLTLFGDLHLHTGMKVHLNDKRYTGKNGYYLVDQVQTRFGTGGYRQTIELPYCISRDKKDEDGKEN